MAMYEILVGAILIVLYLLYLAMLEAWREFRD